MVSLRAMGPNHFLSAIILICKLPLHGGINTGLICCVIIIVRLSYIGGRGGGIIIWP